MSPMATRLHGGLHLPEALRLFLGAGSGVAGDGSKNDLLKKKMLQEIVQQFKHLEM